MHSVHDHDCAAERRPVKLSDHRERDHLHSHHFRSLCVHALSFDRSKKPIQSTARACGTFGGAFDSRSECFDHARQGRGAGAFNHLLDCDQVGCLPHWHTCLHLAWREAQFVSNRVHGDDLWRYRDHHLCKTRDRVRRRS